MLQERLETICARLCLLSALERSPEDPAPLSRRMVRGLIDRKLLDGLVLRESCEVSSVRLEQARRLLARASSVCESLLRYHEAGYRILLPQDEDWPSKLFCLGDAMPLYLFARGNINLLTQRMIAVAGSRDILPSTRNAAERVGCAAAGEGWTLVCGGARGVDAAALHHALLHGGNAIVIPAVPAYEIMKDPICRSAMDAGKLLILCETPPDEGFSTPKALARNHTIYALGNFALVVASRKRKGGSYAGARDCLKGCWTPVFVIKESGTEYEGNATLEEIGAKGIALSEIEGGSLFEDFCNGPCCGALAVQSQISLFE